MVLTYSSGRPGIAYDRARIAGEACERIYNSFAGAKPTPILCGSYLRGQLTPFGPSMACRIFLARSLGMYGLEITRKSPPPASVRSNEFSE
jgi:hypothetical protein